MGVDYVSLGPNQIFLQYYSNNVKQAMLGLGQAARGVRRRMEPIWDAAQNDAAGQGNVEATFQGMSGVISFDLSVFDPAVVKKAMLPLPNLTLTEGYLPSGSIGQFLYKSKNYFRILLYRPYAEAQGLEKFINFPMCRLGNMEEIEGSTEKRIPMVWIVHTPMKYCAGGDATWFNYDGTDWPGVISCPS